MTQHAIAQITPPIVGQQYMLPVGADLGDQTGEWRSMLFIHPDDKAEFEQSLPSLQQYADNHEAQERLTSQLSWPQRAIRISAWKTGFVRVEIGPKAEAHIVHSGSEVYGFNFRYYDLKQISGQALENEQPIKVLPIEAATLLHKAIHHLLINHAHGIDPTDETKMPPTSSVIAAVPRVAAPNHSQVPRHQSQNRLG